MNHYVDLTQTIQPGIPDWDGCCGFQMDEQFYGAESICVQSLSTPSGIGTHMDAPCHFVKDAGDIASITLDKLIAPAVVIDVRHKEKADYLLQPEDVLNIENEYGDIPENALVLALTRWDQYWHDAVKYRNVNASGQRCFPGFSVEAAEYLLTKNIVGIGIDTLSPDGGSESFPVHKIIFGAGKYILENLCHLEKLPPIGATLIALPMKIKNGSEAPCRVIATIELG